jgi:two-component system sensor histidine kinase GlrK
MKFTIFKRLTFGYVAIMGLVIFFGSYATLKLNQLNHLIRDIDSVDGATIRLAEHLLGGIFSQVGFEKKYCVSRDEDFYQQFWETKEYLKKDMEKLSGLVDVPQKKKLFLEAQGLYDRYLFIFKEEAGYIQKGKDYPTNHYQTEKDKLIDEINQKFKHLINAARFDRDHKIRASSQISAQVLRTTAITAGLVILTGILISFFNTKSINRSIMLLQAKTKEIAEGKFEEISNITSPPEIKQLADDFNMMCERLKEVDEMKIDFISHVSHELRTPLTAIKEASSMVIEGTYADSHEKQHELLAIIHEECVRLIDSVNRILDLSRMEAKMMNYHFCECSVVPLIEKSIFKLAPIAQRKNICLESIISQDLPLVNMDEKRIEQVLENLLGNALKYTAEKDSITINAAEKNDGRRYIKVSISDTGSGIPKQDLEKIFDKFQRIESGKGTVRGTGLGLSIAKHIITAHGGKIWAESEAETGSTFYFTLPVS